jgi:hypothetical protein
MADSRPFVRAALATLTLLLGLQLAGCVEAPTEPDQAPPGILTPVTPRQAPPVAPPAAPAARLTTPFAPAMGGPQIALLLPLTGRQSAAAIAVRDGFLTAYYSLPAADRPALRIYDTFQMSVAAALNQATGDGAGLIVGPLTRE